MNLCREKDVNVYVGERESKNLKLLTPVRPVDTILEAPKTKFAVIPQNSLRTSSDLINVLSDIVKSQHNLVNFIVTVREWQGETFVELIEETGAA
jgi:hypothetical protein